VEAAPSAFETRFREISGPVHVSWRELLKTDISPPGELDLPAPPRPGPHPYIDAQEDRRRWQGLLRRHSLAAGEYPIAIRQMLAVLAEMEANELELCARVAAENGGR
jgi:hypothetical protein